MSRRRRTLLLGLSLALLLALGVGAAALWPSPSDAELAATRVEVGMGMYDAFERLPFSCRPPDVEGSTVFGPMDVNWPYPDGSTLSLTISGATVSSVRVIRPPPVNPIVRLRRTLARLIPVLDDRPPATFAPTDLGIG
jgi:hypothetical protein